MLYWKRYKEKRAWKMKRKLESMEDLLQAVEYYGFLPFFSE